MFDILSQRFGRDVREGKRRQYNYIGKREVETYTLSSIYMKFN